MIYSSVSKSHGEFRAALYVETNVQNASIEVAHSTEEGARKELARAIAQWWTNPPAPRDECGNPRARIPACREGREVFDYGTGHGVSTWSPAKWEAVHRIQKDYVRETAQAWKDAAAIVAGVKRSALDYEFSDKCGELHELHAVLIAAAKRRDQRVAELGEV